MGSMFDGRIMHNELIDVVDLCSLFTPSFSWWEYEVQSIFHEFLKKFCFFIDFCFS